MPNSILATPDQVIAALESHGCKPESARSGAGKVLWGRCEGRPDGQVPESYGDALGRREREKYETWE